MADDSSPSLPAPPGLRWEGFLLVPDPESLPFDAPTNGDVDLEDLKAAETCPLCRHILSAIEQLDEPKRSQALMEYGAFKAEMENEEATEEDLTRLLETSPTLEEVVVEHIGFGGLGVEIEDE